MTERSQGVRRLIQLLNRLNGAASLAALFLFAASAFDGGAADGQKPLAHEPLVLVTSAGERTIDAEIASTDQEKATGLMFRTSMADDQGMLFPSDQPRESSMWMRNTFIPLDMVFIRADGTVHRIEAMTEPQSERIIASQGAVLAVLELAGGAAQRLGLKPGDKITHRLFGKP